jgi:hypothetical protein
MPITCICSETVNITIEFSIVFLKTVYREIGPQNIVKGY